MTRRISRVVVFFVATLAVSRSAVAAPITWAFTGPVTNTSGVLNGVIPVGTSASATVTIESTATSNFCGGIGTGGIFSPVSAVLSVGEFNVPYPNGFVMINTSGAGCGPGPGAVAEFIFSGGVWPSIGGSSGFVVGPEMRMLTRGVDGTALTLGEIMGTPQDGFFIVQGNPFLGSDGGLMFVGSLVEQPAPVPEPGSLFLFGTGALLAARATRRKRVNG